MEAYVRQRDSYKSQSGTDEQNENSIGKQGGVMMVCGCRTEKKTARLACVESGLR